MNEATAFQFRSVPDGIGPSSLRSLGAQFSKHQPRYCTEPPDRFAQSIPWEAAIKKILVAMDFSPGCARAGERSAAIAGERGAALTILHVVDVNALALVGSAADLMKCLWEKGLAQLTQLSRTLPTLVQVQTIIEEGLPWEVIVEKSPGFDLLVLGQKHGHARRKIFSRHTTQRVLLNSSCPVLVVDDFTANDAKKKDFKTHGPALPRILIRF